MKIKTALILCAGYGKRLQPITLSTPKPLLKINDITLLEKTLKLIDKLKIKEVKINTFHLQDQIIEFCREYKSDLKIKVIKDGEEILETGGGIVNLMNSTNDEDFIIFNPDTIWDLKYVNELKRMIDYYYLNKLNNLLLVVNKKKSFDKRFKGDFELKKNSLLKYKNNNCIFIGCQILNKNIFKNIYEKSFSISKIWNVELDKNNLNGFESLEEFFHITDLEIFKDIIKR